MSDSKTIMRSELPHQTDAVFLMDGGLETTLIFHDGIDLPYFAAFPLLETETGRDALSRYYRGYLDIAGDHGVGFVLETPTWRASPDWAALLDYGSADLERINRKAVSFLRQLIDDPAYRNMPVVLSGCIGPRGDGYSVGTEMTVEEARDYHMLQVNALAEAGVRMTTALTMTYPQEAAGIALATRAEGLEAVVSFTVETDGRLPNGQTLGSAIEFVDRQTDHAPAYFMVNCAHPDHFNHLLEDRPDWVERIHGVRANASRMSHAELDEAEHLDPGNPAELGVQYADLRRMIPNLNVMGGCCGTDHRHISQIARNTCGL